MLPLVARRAATTARTGSSSSSTFLLFQQPRRPPSIRTKTTSTTTSSSSSSTVGRAAVSNEERVALRAARKEQAAQFIKQQQQQQQQQEVGSATAAAGLAGTATRTAGKTATGSASTSSSASSSSSSPGSSATYLISRFGWMVYGGVPVVLTGLVVWGFQDPNSPPAKFSHWIGLSDAIVGFTTEYAKPAHDKLLPDWSQMPNVPHDIPPPLTLVLDLENTLVGSTWDRKYGWRHAKRPGVDKFLHDMAQYYEIVLYSPSHEGLAAPVVEALDKDGCILHRLFRDATYFRNGVHVKDLYRLNRPLARTIVLDDDPAEVQFNPENLIRVKPFTDPNDHTDTTLARITPFLIEIAREGYNNIPELLKQYQGMDADAIADEQDRRLNRLKHHRQEVRERGLAHFAARSVHSMLEAPELTPGSAQFQQRPAQLTAKDIAGTSPTPSSVFGEDAPGLMGFLNRRAKEKEEHQMRKMELWTQVMMKKQKEKEAKAKEAAQGH